MEFIESLASWSFDLLVGVLVGVMTLSVVQWLLVYLILIFADKGYQPIRPRVSERTCSMGRFPPSVEEYLVSGRHKASKEKAMWLGGLFFQLLHDFYGIQRIEENILQTLNRDLSDIQNVLVSKVSVSKFSLGTKLPTIDSAKLTDYDEKTNDMVVGLDLTYIGDLSITVEAKLKIGTTAFLKLEVSKIQGNLAVVMRSLPTEHVSCSFLHDPEMQFHLRMEVGDRNLNKVANTVAKRIKQIVSQRLVYPNGFVYFFDKSYNSTTQKIRQTLVKTGSMSVSVVGASNLPTKNGSKNCDPFCQITFDKVKVKTKSISKSLSPKWGETFNFDIQSIYWDPKISVEIFDKNTFTKNEPIGSVSIPLSMIPVNTINRKTYKLEFSEGALCNYDDVEGDPTVTLEILILDNPDSSQRRYTLLSDLVTNSTSSFVDVASQNLDPPGLPFVPLNITMSNTSSLMMDAAFAHLDITMLKYLTHRSSDSSDRKEGNGQAELQALFDGLSDQGFLSLRAYAQRNITTSHYPVEYVELELLRSLLGIEIRRLHENKEKLNSMTTRIDVQKMKEVVTAQKERLRNIWFGSSHLSASIAGRNSLADIIDRGHKRAISMPDAISEEVTLTDQEMVKKKEACHFYTVPGLLLVWLDSICFHFETVKLSCYDVEGPLTVLRAETVISQVHWFVLTQYSLTQYDKRGHQMFPELIVPLDEVVQLKHQPGENEGYVRITMASGKKHYLGRAEDNLLLATWYQKLQCAILVAKHQTEHATSHCLNMAFQNVTGMTQTADSVTVIYQVPQPMSLPEIKTPPTKVTFSGLERADLTYLALQAAWKNWTPMTVRSLCSCPKNDMQPRDPFFQLFRVRVFSTVREYACQVVNKISHSGFLYICNEYLGFHMKSKQKHMVLVRMEQIKEAKTEKKVFKTLLILSTAYGESLSFHFEDENERNDCMGCISLRLGS